MRNPLLPTARVFMQARLTGAADYRWRMRLGLNLSYLVGTDDVAGQLRLTQHAEELGFDVVWAAEAYGSDSPDAARLAGRADHHGSGSARR